MDILEQAGEFFSNIFYTGYWPTRWNWDKGARFSWMVVYHRRFADLDCLFRYSLSTL